MADPTITRKEGILSLIDRGHWHDAREVGSCSWCTEQITPKGTAEGSMVKEVSLSGLRARLCPSCWSLFLDEATDILAWSGRI